MNDRDVGAAISVEELQALIKSAPFDGPCCGTSDCEAPDVGIFSSLVSYQS